MLQAIEIGSQIVNAILVGQMRAGMRLGEQRLAQVFSVSRTIIREALIQLETCGIAETCVFTCDLLRPSGPPLIRRGGGE